MDQELFNPQSSSVTSSRILYTPSTFARTSLLHLQEVGSLQAIYPHTSTRTNLTSFLCFVVLSGNGTLTYEGTTYELSAGDCVFIDCRKAYSHSTSDDLWSLQEYSGVRPHKEKINISKEIINKTRGAVAPYAAQIFTHLSVVSSRQRSYDWLRCEGLKKNGKNTPGSDPIKKK